MDLRSGVRRPRAAAQTHSARFALLSSLLVALSVASGSLAAESAATRGGTRPSILDAATLPRFGVHAGIPNVLTAAGSDTFPIAGYGFDALSNTCQPRGWTTQDRTGLVFAHVSDRYVVNQSFFAGRASGGSVGPGLSAPLPGVLDMTMTSFGSLLITEPGSQLLEVFPALDSIRIYANLPSGMAGNYQVGFDPTNGDAITTRFGSGGGNIYRTPRSTLLPTLVAGDGMGTGDTLGLFARLETISDIAVDDLGNIYFSESGQNRVRMVRKNDGRVVHLWGDGTNVSGADGAVAATSGCWNPRGLDVQGSTLYVVEVGAERVRTVDLNTGLLGSVPGFPIGNSNIDDVVVDGATLFVSSDLGPSILPAVYRVEGGVATILLNTVDVPDFGPESEGALASNYSLRGFQSVRGFDSDGTGGLYFGDPERTLLLRLRSDLVVEPVAGEVVPISMGDRALWFAADASSAPEEVANWVHSEGYGGGWSQRLTSPAIPIVGHPEAVIEFDVRVELDALSNNLGIGSDPSRGYFIGLQYESPGGFNFAQAAVQVPNGTFSAQWIGGVGIARYRAALGGYSAGDSLKVRIIVQTPTSGNNEDGGQIAGQGAAIVDNIRVHDGGTDLIPPTDFEDGTTGVWTLTALNGAYAAPFGFPIIRDIALPMTQITLRKNYDFSNNSCVWTFTRPEGGIATGAFARLTSPWLPMTQAQDTVLVAVSGKLSLQDQGRPLSFQLRFKDEGQSRPKSTYAPLLVESSRTGSDVNSPYLENLVLSFAPGSGAPFSTNAEEPGDSVQLVITLEDRIEEAAAGTRRPTQLPYLDNILVLQSRVDQDGDGVPDDRDACPSESAIGQDADGNGCVDPTATMRHVETWTEDHLPIRYAIRMGGSPVIGDGSDLTAIRNAVASWTSTPGAQVPIVENPPVSKSNAETLDGLNLVTWEDDLVFPPDVLAVTPTTSFTTRAFFDDQPVLPGAIVDSDLIFNPNVRFRTPGTGPIPNSVDLESVAAHEFGHMLGLSHSGVPEATMNPVLQADAGAASLESDDHAAIGAAYPSAAFANFGTITGTVIRGQDSQPIPGALVTAHPVTGGTPGGGVASDYSDELGRYALRGLVAGDYVVQVAPLDGSIPGVVPEAVNARVQESAQTNFLGEYFSEPETDRDDPSQFAVLALGAGATLASVNVITTVDTIPPMVVSVLPAADAINVGIDGTVLLNFSEPITAATLQDAFSLRAAGSAGRLGGSGKLIGGGTTLIFTPTDPLEFGNRYEIELTTALTDLEGVAMATTFLSTFETLALPSVAITDINPRQAPPGAVITIAGAGFVPGVGGTLVNFTVASGETTVVANATATSAVVRVPATAITGPVQVSIAPSLERSNPFNFTVIQPLLELPVASGAPVSLLFSPSDVVVAPDGANVFAAGALGFATINLSPSRPNFRQAAPLDLRGGSRVALSPDGLRAYVTRPDSGDVVEVDADSSSAGFGQLYVRIPTGGRPDGITFSADGARAYVTDASSGRVFRLDVDPFSPTFRMVVGEYTLPLASLTGGIVVDPGAPPQVSQLYATSNNQGLIQVAVQSDSTYFPVIAAPTEAAAVFTVDATHVYTVETLPFETRLRGTCIRGVCGPPTILDLGGTIRDLVVPPRGGSLMAINSALNSVQVVGLSGGAALAGQVSAGQSPVAGSFSASGALLAVANAGDRSIALFGMSNAGSEPLRFVVPPVATQGEIAITIGSTDMWNVPPRAVVAGTSTPVFDTQGFGGPFAVPNLAAQRTEVYLQETSGSYRSFPLPFQIVDPVESFAPKSTGIGFALGQGICPATTIANARALAVSPDGSMLAVGRDHPTPCESSFDLYRLTADGTNVFASLIASNIGIVGYSIPINAMAFTADGKRLFVAVNLVEGMTSFDVDPNSPTFGTPGGGGFGGPFLQLKTNAFLERTYALENGDFGTIIAARNPDASYSFDRSFTQVMDCLAVSPSGQHVVAGGQTHALILDENLNTLSTTPDHSGPISQVAITRDGRRAIGFFAGGAIAVWDLTTSPPGAEIYFGAGLPTGLTLSDPVPGGNTHSVIVGTHNTNNLYAVDVTSVPPTVTAVDVGQRTSAIAIAPGGRQLWVSDNDNVSTSNIRLFALSDAASLDLLSGNAQQGLAGTVLPLPVEVVVQDESGHPESGVVVEFALAGNAGQLDGFATTVLRRITGVDGRARAFWTMPAIPGPCSLTITALGTGLDPIVVGAESIEDESVAAPVLIRLGPTDGSTGLNATTEVFAFFSQRMDPATTGPAIQLTVNGDPVPGTVRFENEDRQVFFKPAAPLPYAATCVLSVSPGALDQQGQVLASGGASTFTVQDEPTLAATVLSPPAGPPGASVTINGQGFSTVPSLNVVRFGGVPAAIVGATATSVVAVVPATALTGPVTVQVGTTLSNGLPFTVLPAAAESTAVVDSLPGSPGSFAIAVTPDGGRAYVANSATNTVGAIDIASASILATIPVGLEPRAVAILPDGSRAYSANYGSNDVSVIDSNPASSDYNRRILTIPVGEKPIAIAVTPVGPQVIVVHAGDQNMSIIDAQPENATYDQVVKNVNLGSGGSGITISPDGARAFITTSTGVAIVDLSSFVVKNVNLGSGGSGITISPDGGLLYVLTEAGELVVISVAPGTEAQVVKNVNLGSGGSGITISPDGTRLFVTLEDTNEVLVFEISTSSQGGDQVTKLPGPAVTLTLVATVAVGDHPAGVAADPFGRFVLVANQNSGEISVLGKPEPVTPSEPVPVVAEFKLYPNYLRIRDRYFWRWVRGSIEPPAPYNAHQIVISSIRLNDVVPVDTTWFKWFQDWDFDGRQELSVAFRRAALALTLPNADTTVAVFVTGVVADTPFVGVDSLRVKPKRLHRPHHEDNLTPGQLFTIEYDRESAVIQWVAVLHSLDGGESWETDLTHLPNTGAIPWTVPNTVTDSAMVAVVEVEDDSDPEGTVIGVLGMSDLFQIRGPLPVVPPPVELALSPVMPNPASGRVMVRFGLPRKSDVSLEVFDIAGRRVCTLVDEVRDAGWHDVAWDGRGSGGSPAGPGLYFLRLQAEGRKFHQRVVRLN